MNSTLNILRPVMFDRSLRNTRESCAGSEHSAHPFLFGPFGLPALEQFPTRVDGATQQQQFHEVLHTGSAQHAPVRRWMVKGRASQ